MRVYRIEYREYEYQPGVFGGSDYRSDYILTPSREKRVMADNALDAMDLLPADVRHRSRLHPSSTSARSISRNSPKTAPVREPNPAS